MSWPDMVNGAFELLGSIFILLSVRKLWQDKLVRGVHWAGVAFFASWGCWNLYFYPHLDQWMSFAGGLAIVTANAIWLAQMAYYIRAEQRLRSG